MKKALAFVIMIVAVMTLHPQYPWKIPVFIRVWPFLFALLPALSFFFTDGVSALREAFSGKNLEFRQRLQKRIVVFGFLTFLVQTATVLKLLDHPDSIGPCVTVWIVLAFYLGLQSWLLS
ncbi:MAG TPA: hypothetical protein VFO10_19515 [Oligoflexus sp.]|uniref:hypothetical protein n=1 Tax=Oligoflexus sp. TaxID=1971216 RepID=UPI002D7EE0A9|nr:hypothetical protein [Oligoflexus sp.]HET9239460.1 hypothetical protein [Oligoflexus sp.]